MLPGSKGSVDVSVEEAPAASEYTKMGGCVGLRLSRVTWSYVLAESPFPHSPFSIWLTYEHWAQGQEGLPAVRDKPKYRRPPPTSLLPTVHPTLTRLAQIDFCPGTSQDTTTGTDPISRANHPGRGQPSKAAAAKTFLAAWRPRDVKAGSAT